MVETPELVEAEQKQIKKPPTDNDQESLSPIQKKLQQKFDTFDIKDETEQKIITDFFENIEKKLPETHKEELIKYIENMGENRLKEIWTFDEIDQEEESSIIKKSIEQIDINAWQPIIDTYSNIEDERSNIEDEKDKKTNEIVTIEDKEKNDNEIKKALNEARDAFKDIPDWEKTKWKLKDQDQDQQEIIKQKVDKINKSNPEKPITADEFISMQLTSQKLKWNPKYQDFITKFETLDKLSWPKGWIIKPEDFNWENAISYQNEIIKSNPKINDYVQQINWWTSNYQEKNKTISNLKDKDVENEFNKEENQKLFDKYKTLLPQEPKEDPNKTTEENLKERTDRQRGILLEINNLEEQTQSTIQKRVFGSTISWLTSFFDFSTWQKENLWENFEFSKEKWFDIDPVNNIFYLWGNIKENNINISYNLWNGNLSVEDHLFQTQDQNVLNFWKEKFQDLKIKLPPIQLLTEQARQISEKEVSGKNSQEYINNLERNIHESLLSNFRWNEEIVKIRLERNIQKNLATQETLSNFKSIISPENKDIYWSNFNQQEKPELFNLVKILDDSLESYSISESKEFRENMETLTKFIQGSTEKQWEPNIIGRFFRKLFKKQENKSTIETEEKNTKNLLNTIEKLSISKEWKKTIDINFLKKTVSEIQKAEPDLDKIPESLSESITNPNPGKLLDQEWLRPDRPPTA